MNNPSPALFRPCLAGAGVLRLLPKPAAVFAAIRLSLAWVGFQGYRYNVPMLNSPVINWYAFLLWSAGLLVTLRLHEHLRARLGATLLVPVLTWLAYFSGLLLVEYLGYRILGVRLVTPEGPLIFGLIHGTALLKAYYLSAGPLVVLYAASLRWLFGWHALAGYPAARLTEPAGE